MNYINAPFPYAGCKYNLLSHIDKAIPQGDTLYDVFGGSAAVGVNLAYRFNTVIVTDKLRDLIAMHRTLQQDNPDMIIARLKELSSKDPARYAQLRDEYNASPKYSPDRGYRLYGLILSCTNNLMRFNLKGGFNQTCGKRQLTDNKEREIREWCGRLNALPDKKIMFGYGPYLSVLNRIAETAKDESSVVIYLDPPYSNTEAGYNVAWTVEDDDRLADFMLTHPNYKYVLSSCSKGNSTTKLVKTLQDSGMYSTTCIPHVYKAAKKTKDVETTELILRSNNCDSRA